MDDMTIMPPVKTKAKISEREMARRRKAMRKADAHNRIEGIYRGVETDEIVESFVRGDIELPDLVAHLTAPPAPR